MSGIIKFYTARHAVCQWIFLSGDFDENTKADTTLLRNKPGGSHKKKVKPKEAYPENLLGEDVYRDKIETLTERKSQYQKNQIVTKVRNILQLLQAVT